MLPLHNTKIGQEPGGAVTRRYELLLILKISNSYLLFILKQINKTNLFVSKIFFVFFLFLENWDPSRNKEWRERERETLLLFNWTARGSHLKNMRSSFTRPLRSYSHRLIRGTPTFEWLVLWLRINCMPQLWSFDFD